MDPIYVVSLIVYLFGSVGMFVHAMDDDEPSYWVRISVGLFLAIFWPSVFAGLTYQNLRKRRSPYK